MCTCGNPKHRNKKLIRYAVLAVIIIIVGLCLPGCAHKPVTPKIVYPRLVTIDETDGYTWKIWQREDGSRYLELPHEMFGITTMEMHN